MRYFFQKQSKEPQTLTVVGKKGVLLYVDGQKSLGWKFACAEEAVKWKRLSTGCQKSGNATQICVTHKSHRIISHRSFLQLVLYTYPLYELSDEKHLAATITMD